MRANPTKANALFRHSLTALWQAHIVSKIKNITKYIAEGSDGSIIPPVSNMTAMKYGIMLSHVVKSGDILICCGVSRRSGEESTNPWQQTTHVIDTAITATSGTMILQISSAETPSNLQDWKKIFC